MRKNPIRTYRLFFSGDRHELLPENISTKRLYFYKSPSREHCDGWFTLVTTAKNLLPEPAIWKSERKRQVNYLSHIVGDLIEGKENKPRPHGDKKLKENSNPKYYDIADKMMYVFEESFTKEIGFLFTEYNDGDIKVEEMDRLPIPLISKSIFINKSWKGWFYYFIAALGGILLFVEFFQLISHFVVS